MNVNVPDHRKRRRSLDRGQRLLLVSVVLSILLWYLPGGALVVYPIRLFVTFVHEGAHALAGALTGAGQITIAVFPNGSGVTQSAGGNALLITMAGYLGAMAFGASMLLWSRRAPGQTVLATMLACIGVVAVLWVRNGFGLVAAAGLVFILAVLMSVRKRGLADFVAAFLAVQLCLNALLDLRTLLLVSTMSEGRNDAAIMAQTFGLTPLFWALLWAVAGVAMLATCLRAYWGARASATIRQ